MARMTGGEVLVQSLYREGIRVVFGLPGVQLYGVMAALRDEPRIRFITTRHEQATSYMADGYARAGGDVGTGLVVPGPGLLNSTAGPVGGADLPTKVDIETDEAGPGRIVIRATMGGINQTAGPRTNRIVPSSAAFLAFCVSFTLR